MSSAPAIIDTVRDAAAQCGITAFLNQAPERGAGVNYAAFVFRSEVPTADLQGVNMHRAAETIDFIVYHSGTGSRRDDETERGLAAIGWLQKFLQTLGPSLMAMSGLETGVTEQGYHYARRRLTINPHR